MSLAPLKPGGEAGPTRSAVLTAVILIRIVGVVGFVGLLVAAHFSRGAGDGWRVAALAWFFVSGIAYVLVSLKTPAGGRRWR